MFNPLNIKTCYSFLESGLDIETIISCAKKYNLKTIGISDNSNFFAFPSFQKACNENGIKPILGNYYQVEDYIIHYIIKNDDGYKSLLKINELFRNNNLTLEEAKKYSKGLIAILPLEENNIRYDSYFENNKTRIFHDFTEYSKIGESFYFGYDCPDTSYFIKDKEAKNNSIIKDLINRTYKIVYFPLLILEKEKDKPLISILGHIKNQTVETDFSNFNYSKVSSFEELQNAAEYFQPQDIDGTTLDIIKNIDEIISQVDFNLFKKRGQMVSFTSDGSSKELLKKMSLEGLKKKIGNDIPKNYIERLDYELDVISSLNFDDYFLIVQDYVNYAKDSGIYVGPGRGSSGASIVSYALNITEVDPIKYDLFFERFLSKSRKTMPDIDVDFEDTRRGDIVTYLKNKYNENEVTRVSNIITFQTFKLRQALRDVAKVTGYLEDSKLKNILNALDRGDEDLTINQVYKKNSYFKQVVDGFMNTENYDETKHLLKYASLIEGFPRQTSIHASGIILNNENLSDVIPLYNNKDIDCSVEVPFEYLEEMGFLKMDLLSLINLSDIHNVIDLINKNHNTNFAFNNLPIEDKNAIKLIREGYTNKIFQLEKEGMITALRKIKPNNFKEVADTLSLHRPGALDQIDNYALLKEGKKKVTYLHPILKDILEPTYGIIIYQEQIIRIANKFAGLTFEEADNFRRAISKKKVDELSKLETMFIEGSIRNGIDKKIAKQVFDLIFKFAQYGFAKIHAVEYAIISSRMAFLKANYPKEFFAVLLDNNYNARGETFFKLIRDLYFFHIPFSKVSINEIGYKTKILENSLMYSLECLLSINKDLIKTIIDERTKNGNYKSFDDFIVRLSRKKLPGIFVRDLINIGAFDFENENRNYFLNRLNTFLEDSKNIESYVKEDIGMLLDLEDVKPNPDDFEKLDPITIFLNEYKALRFIPSEIKNLFPSIETKDYVPICLVHNANPYFTTCGLISEISIRHDKNQKIFAKVTLIDSTYTRNFMIFNTTFEPIKETLSVNKIVKVSGRKSENNGRISYIINTIKILP